MVIGPNELEKKFKETQSTLVKAVETSIDKYLEQRYDGLSSVTIGVDSFKGMNRLTREALISKYRVAGWEVKYTSDQRDGDFYQFNKKLTDHDQYWHR